MEKFSLEFKKVVSEKYLEGELSLKSVARMYGISPYQPLVLYATGLKNIENMAKMLSFEKIKRVFLCRIKAPFQHHHYQH